MKKVLAVLLTSFALVQSIEAIPSNLGQSIIIDQTILSSSELIAAVPPGEFIVDLKRETKDLQASQVIYEIKTVYAAGDESVEVGLADVARVHYKENKYKVLLTLVPNPVLGPPLITIDSITKVDDHCHKFFSSP